MPKTTTAIFTTSTTIMSLTPHQRTRTRLFSNQSLPKVPPRQPGSRSKAFFFALLSFSFPSLVRPSSGRRGRGGCVLSAEERRCRGRGRGGALAEEQPRGRNLSFLFLHPSLTSPCQPFFAESVDGKTPQNFTNPSQQENWGGVGRSDSQFTFQSYDCSSRNRWNLLIHMIHKRAFSKKRCLQY